MKVISILIPAYNEEAYILQVLDRLRTLAWPDEVSTEVLVIDDGSTDRTTDLVKEFSHKHAGFTLHLHQLPKNQGKGAALRYGIDHAQGDFVLVQDADLEYDPSDILPLLTPALQGQADVVYGSRFIGNKPHRVLYFWHFVGNRWLTTFTNLVANLNLTDMETGYKLIRATMAKSLKLKEARFGIEPELTIKLARIPNIRFYEIGIAYYGRTYAEGKKIGWRDGLRALWCITYYGIFRQ